MVDYDDDEDEEDYKPPPKKMADSSEEDEGLTEFPLKRKLAHKEEPEAKRLHLSPKALKPRAAFSSNLKEGGLSNKKQATENTPPSSNRNSSEEAEVARTEEVSSKSCSDTLDESAGDRNLGDERPLLSSPKSSPEMAVKGS